MTAEIVRFPDIAGRPVRKPRPVLRASQMWQKLSDAADAADRDAHVGDYRRFTVLHRLAMMQLAASYLIDPNTGAKLPREAVNPIAYEMLIDLAVELPDLALTLLASDLFGEAATNSAA